MKTRGPPGIAGELHRTTHDGRAYRSQRSRVELLHRRWQPAIYLHPGESREASQWTTLIHQLCKDGSEGDRLPAPALAIDLREDHWRRDRACPSRPPALNKEGVFESGLQIEVGVGGSRAPGVPSSGIRAPLSVARRARTASGLNTRSLFGRASASRPPTRSWPAAAVDQR